MGLMNERPLISLQANKPNEGLCINFLTEAKAVLEIVETFD